VMKADKFETFLSVMAQLIAMLTSAIWSPHTLLLRQNFLRHG
jgi:hypothetical protein